MSIFSTGAATVVRQRPNLALSIVAGIVVFVVVGAAAFCWKYRQLPAAPQLAGPLQATAKVIIHSPNFAADRAWNEILAESRSDVRDHLRSKSEHRGDATVISVSASDLPRESLVPLVNVVASAFVQTCRSQWKVETEQAYSNAQERLREAQRAAAEADSRLEALQRRRSEAAAAAPAAAGYERPDEHSVVMVDNPQWTEAVRRLGELEERRRVLLFERTPLHPSVQEIEMRISDMRREMATIPPKIAQATGATQSTPFAIRLPPVLPAELEAAQQDGRDLASASRAVGRYSTRSADGANRRFAH